MDPHRSPGTPWKKPSDVMKNLRKSKRRASLMSMKEFQNPQPPIKKCNNISTKVSVNPFRRRQSLSDCMKTNSPADDKDIGAFSMFRTLNSASDDGSSQSASNLKSVMNMGTENNYSARVPNVKWLDSLPVDWSLKWKARFISKKPFSWTGNLKTCEEASGITGFVRCLGGLSSESSDQERQLDTSSNAHFHQCCLVWMYPYYPWLKLFPRTGTGSAKTSDKVSMFSTEPEIQEKLYEDWCDSFRSLYQLVRARQCPYFYVCSHNFTALFRAAGISGIDEIHALLTPSTRGLRETLRQEGVIFTLPLKKSREQNGDFLSADNTLDVDADGSVHYHNYDSSSSDEEEGCDEPIEWLEEMGLEMSSFPELDPNRIKIKSKKTKEVDYSPESLLYVEGVEIQGLFNFLLNNKNGISSTGPLAGVPPTLLAPVAFQRACLYPLQAKQAWMQQEKNKYHVIQLSGPILPHNVSNLCELFKSSQDGDFTAVFGTVDQTSSFTSFNKSQSSQSIPSIFAQQNLTDCGLPNKSLAEICATPKGSSILKHLSVENGRFSCS